MPQPGRSMRKEINNILHRMPKQGRSWQHCQSVLPFIGVSQVGSLYPTPTAPFNCCEIDAILRGPSGGQPAVPRRARRHSVVVR